MVALMRGLLLSILLSASCNLAGGTEARAYADKLAPVLQENGLLADQVLAIASTVHTGDDDPDAVRAHLAERVVPVAEHLHHQASFLEVGSSFEDRHQALVAIWAERAAAYRDLLDALTTGDREQWTRAIQLATDVKLKEEQWFQETNDELGAGARLDPYP
jgi:hypothetical protein